MSSAGSIEAWVAAGMAAMGEPDALLVNAGGPPPGDFETLAGDEPWQAAFNLTLMSSVRLIRAVLPSLKAKGGSITAPTCAPSKTARPVYR